MTAQNKSWVGGLLVVLAALVTAGPARAGDWPQFRGPGGTAVSAETGLPTRWGPDENLHWKADLPGRGLSSPVIAAGKVYITACTGPLQGRLHVLAFDADTGKKLWERQLHATGNTLCHSKTCMAAPSPVTDGERVFALFATGDLAAFDAAGNLLWYRALARDYPAMTNQVGMAASPILWQDVLLLPMESAGASFAAGLDARTGRNLWKVERPREINWVTPLLLAHSGRAEVLFQSGQEVTAYDAASGKKRWTHRAPSSGIPSAAAGDGLVVLASGVALRLGQEDAGPQVAWKAAKLRPAYGSPVYYDGRVYALNSSSIVLNCFAGKDGKVLWQERVQGPFAASPVAGDGKVYLVNEAGLTTVIQAGDRPAVLGRNALGETILATPAIANGAIFLRSDQHLFCVKGGRRPLSK
jgi:outer membrane protein assembly factor BamB